MAPREIRRSGKRDGGVIRVFLNSFYLIQRIQGISTYLATDTLPVMVILGILVLLPLVRYLLPLTTLN